MIDKQELLSQGKHFGRIFLDYLCQHSEYSNGRGGVRQRLADELLTIGQSEGLTEKETLEVASVVHWRDGRYKIPFWANRAALILASESGFVVEHAADAVAVVATVMVDYSKEKTLSLAGLLIFIEQRYQLTIGEHDLPVVRLYLASRGVKVTD